MMSNPLLEPIHGISLYDYAAGSAKITAGVEEKEICKALGVEPAVYEEASALWITRMQEDNSFEVTTAFGQYFGEANQHPLLKNLQANVSEAGKENLERMKTDRYYFEELNGARQAAYIYGYDGAQWIQDNFGINLGDFQSVSMEWMARRDEEVPNDAVHYMDYRREKEAEYANKFAAEQGGNIADDVEF